jgi:hypothetical protein
MKDSILIGRRKAFTEIPAKKWRQHLVQAEQHSAALLSFMKDDHHRVRNFVVRELPRNHEKPLRSEDIAQSLHLPLDLVSTILDDLQKHLFFLVRNQHGEVSWAFPVTSDSTPHNLRFSSGEHVFAA